METSNARETSNKKKYKLNLSFQSLDCYFYVIIKVKFARKCSVSAKLLTAIHRVTSRALINSELRY